jgi:prevent-host-death family protein
MNAVTLKDPKLNLEELVEQVIADAEATIVLTKSGDKVVVLPLDQFERMRGRATSGLSTDEIMALTRGE